jgi:hypothetical protein
LYFVKPSAAVTDGAHDGIAEMIWEGKLFTEAEAQGELACYGLEKIYRTVMRRYSR